MDRLSFEQLGVDPPPPEKNNKNNKFWLRACREALLFISRTFRVVSRGRLPFWAGELRHNHKQNFGLAELVDGRTFRKTCAK